MNVREREKKGESAFARLAEARRRTAAVRPRWASLTGSILAGVLVGAWLWSGGPGNSLGDDVLSHMDDEPEALAAANVAVDPAAAARVLEQGGIRLGPGAGEVLYANSCRFRGRSVPHLVLQSEAGRVTVLVLRHEPVDGPVSIARQGFSGRIVPAGPGSIAVVGAAGADLKRVAVQVRAAVEWF